MAQEGWLDESLDDGDFGDSVKADEVSSEKAASEHGKGEELMFPPTESDLATDDAATNHDAIAKDVADFDASGALRADLNNGMNRMLDELAASHHQNIGETLSVVSRAATRGSTTSSLAGSILVGEDDRDGETDDEGDHMGTMPDPLGTPMLPPPPLSMDALSQAATKATSEGGDDIVDAIATEDQVLNREIFRNTSAGENPETLPENASITTNVHSDAPVGAMSMTYSNRGADLDLEGPQGAYQPLDGLDVASSAAVSEVSGVDELPPESATPDVHGHPPSMHDTGPESTASPVNEESSLFATVSYGAQGDSAMLDPERTSPIPQYNRSPQQHHDHYDPSQLSSQGRNASPEDAGNDFTAPSGDHTSAHGHAPLSHPMPMAHTDHDIPELSTSPSPPLSTRAHFPLDESRNEDSASMSSQHLPGHFAEDSIPFQGMADPCVTSEVVPQSATSVVGSETHTSGVDAPTSQVPSPDAPSAPESIQNASASTPPPNLPPQVDVETSPSGSGPFGAISPPPPPHDGAIVEDQPSQDSIGLFGTNTPPPPSQASAFDNSSYPSEYETQTASGQVEASFPSAPPMDSSHAKDSPLQNTQASFEASSQQPPQNTSFAPGEDTQSASELFGSSSSDMPPQGSPFDDAQPAQNSRSPFEVSITPPPLPQESSYVPEDAPKKIASGLFETSSPPAPPQGSPFDNSQPLQNAGGLFEASSLVAPPPQGSPFDEDQAPPNAGGLFGASSPSPPPQDSSYVPGEEPHSASGLFGASFPSAPPQGSPFDDSQAPQNAGGVTGASSPSPPPQDSSYVPGEEPHSASGLFGASSPSAPSQDSTFDDAQPPQNAGSLFGASSPSPPPQDSSYVPGEEPHSASGLFGASSPSAPPQDSTSDDVQPPQNAGGLFGASSPSPPPQDSSYVAEEEPHSASGLFGASSPSAPPQGSPFDDAQPPQNAGGLFGASSPSAPPQDSTSDYVQPPQNAGGLFGASSPPQDSSYVVEKEPHSARGLFGASSPSAPPQDSTFDDAQPPQNAGGLFGASSPSPPPQDSSHVAEEEPHSASGLFGASSPSAPPQDSTFDDAQPPQNAGGLFGASSPSAPPQGSPFDDSQPPQGALADFSQQPLDSQSSPNPPPQDSLFAETHSPQDAGSLFGAASQAPPSQDTSFEEAQPHQGAADFSEGADATPQDGMFDTSFPDEAAQDASNLFAAPSSPPSDNAFASSEVPHDAAMSPQAPGADVGGENLTSPSQEGNKELTSGSPLPKAPPQEGFGGLMPNASPVQTSEEVQETSDLFGSGEEQSPAEPTASPGASPSASPGHGGGLFVDTPGEDVTGTAEGLFASPSKGGALAAGSPNTPNAEGLFGSSSSSDLFADGADDSANLFDRSPTKARASGQEAFGGESSQFYQGHPQEVPQQHYQQSGYAPNQQQYPPSQYPQDYAYQGQQQDQMYYQDQQSMPIDDARSRQGSLQSFGSGHYSQQNTFEAPAMQNSPQSHPSRRESVTSGASRMSQHTHMAFPQPQPMYPPSGDLGSDRFSQPSTGTVNTNTAQDYSQGQPDGVNPEDAQVYAMNTGGWEQDPQAPLGAAEAMSPGNEFSLSFQQDETQQQSQQQQQDDQAGHHAGGLPDMRQLDPSLLAGRVVAPRRMSGSSNFSSATGISRPLPSMPDNPIVGFGNIRRQDGRRPHALAIWGFGGRLVTMFPQRRRRLGSFTDQGLAGTRQAKSSSLGQESDAGKQTHEKQAESLVQSKLRQGRVQIFSLADLAAVSPSAWLVDRQIRFPGPLVALPPGSAPVDHRLVADFLQREIDAHAPADNGAFVSKLLWQVIQLFLRGEGDLQGKDVLADLLGVLRAPAPSTQTVQAEAKAEADGSQQAGETGADVDDDEAEKDKGDEGDKGEEDVAGTVPAIPDSIAFKTSSNLSDEAARSAMMDIEAMLEAGDREGAVVRAIESELWAQALIISNFVSVAAYRRVVERFVHATMPRNSQSHALFLLFAGLGEKALALDTEGASADNASPPLQDTWRRTLSAILANRTPGDTELITSLGDRLWSDLGDARAAHICYLAAGVPLNSTSGSRMILVGGDHKSCESHRLFVTPETIERTELYLYGLSSRHSFYRFDGFHPYRLVYAMWLADLGAVKQAYAWVRSIQEVIKARSPSKRSSSSSSVGGSPRRSGPFPHAFQRQLKIFADRLMTSEAKALGIPEQMQQSEDSSWIPLRLSSLWRKSSKHPGQQQLPSQDPLGGPPAGQAPTWNPNGPRVDTGVNNNNNNNAPESGNGPQPPMMMPPAASSSGPFGHEPPSAMSSVGGGDQPTMAGGLPPLHPSGMGPGGEGNNFASGGQGNNAVGTPSLGVGSNNNNREESSAGSGSVTQNQKKETMGSAKAKEGDEAKATEGGWGLTSWMKKVLPKSNVKKGTTGNKLDAYYDKKLGKWIFPGDDPNAGPTAPAAPPKMEELRPSSAPASGDGPAAPSGPPQYSAGVGFRRGNTKSRYVDSFAQSGLMSDTPRPDTAPGNSGLGAPPTPLQQMMMPPGASNPMMPPQIGSFPPGPSGLGGPGGGPPKFSVFKPPPAPVAEEPSAGDSDPAGPEAMDDDRAQAGDLAAQGGDGASEGPMAPPPPSQLSTPPPPAMAE